jgi:hypothetical protein
MNDMKDSARYVKIVAWSDEDGCFVGISPGLLHGGCHGDDEHQVFAELCRIVEETIELYRKDGKPLPAPTSGNDFANRMLRLGQGEGLFRYDFPVFMLVGNCILTASGDVSAFENPLTIAADGDRRGLALFTDRDAAEQFRDQHAPHHRVFSIGSAETLVVILSSMKKLTTNVVIDPLRVGLFAKFVPIDALLRWLPPGR